MSTTKYKAVWKITNSKGHTVDNFVTILDHGDIWRQYQMFVDVYESVIIKSFTIAKKCEVVDLDKYRRERLCSYTGV